MPIFLFMKEPESQTAAEGESVIFECEAGGFPAPKVSKSPIYAHPDKLNHLLTTNTIKVIAKHVTLPDQLGSQREENRGCSSQSSQNRHQQLHHDCQPDKTGDILRQEKVMKKRCWTLLYRTLATMGVMLLLSESTGICPLYNFPTFTPFITIISTLV